MIYEYNDRARYFWERHSTWSQATFGLDGERGPLGALRHLEKEAGEAQQAYHESIVNDDRQMAKLKEEIADCLFLTFDSARRAGMTFDQLFDQVEAKFEKNKKRVWQKPTQPNQPVEHVRGIHD